MSYLGNGFGLYSVVSIIDENDIVIMSTFLCEKLKKIGRSCGGGDGGGVCGSEPMVVVGGEKGG